MAEVASEVYFQDLPLSSDQSMSHRGLGEQTARCWSDSTGGGRQIYGTL